MRGRAAPDVVAPQAAGLASPATTAEAAATAPSPLKLEQQPVDDAIQSLLGLAEAPSGEMTATGPWDNWEASGSGRDDALLHRRLSASDLQHSRLRIPVPLFQLLFGTGPSRSSGRSSRSRSGGVRVALQVAGGTASGTVSGQAQTLEVTAVLAGGAYLLAGEAVQQLYRALHAEPSDLISLRFEGSANEGGLPTALCSLAEKAAWQRGRRRAAGTAAAGAAGRHLADSPGSPVQLLLPAAGSGATPFPLHSHQQQQQQQQQHTGRASKRLAGEEPAAPPTIAIAESLAAGPGEDADAEAAAVLAAAADDGSEKVASAAAVAPATDGGWEGGEEEEEVRDPDWRDNKPKGRGRPRKRRRGGSVAAAGPASGRGAAAGAAALSCAHCGALDTPRWWKDNFPIGTLCNACGIWLKRHGYPRPVQFFIDFTAADATTGSAKVAAAAQAAQRQQAQQAAAQQQQQAAQQQQGSTAGVGGSSREAAVPVEEYYLINGRPKRRRSSLGDGAAAAAAAAAAAVGGAPSSSAAGATATPGGGEGGEVPPPAPVTAAAAASDPPINFEAAGSRVFVVRRKLLKAEGTTEQAAALVQFGWAPGSRPSHDMFSAVARFGEASQEVTVDDFELLSDCKAAATLQLRPGASIASWDGLVRRFVDSL